VSFFDGALVKMFIIVHAKWTKISVLHSKITSNALSFYKSQNSLCWSKFFASDQILFRYCARPKLFVPNQKRICI
jgi:hypothetical protein